MPRATVPTGMELEYETFGVAADPPLLLVTGLGSQMVSWDEELCRRLADSGHLVIRYDNRDVGRSSRVDRRVDVLAAFDAHRRGAPIDPPYTLADMADDAVGLLDHLGIDRAHVVGASMGGMILQTMAIAAPDRVRSATSVMSTTGAPDVGQPTPEAAALLVRRRARTEDDHVAMTVETDRLLNGPALPFDEERSRAKARLTWERGYDPAGVARQLVAILASPDRTLALRQVDLPFLVIHGKVDPLVTVSGGEATADAVPGAELVVVDDMGHSLPPAHWPTVVGAVVAHTRRAD